MAGKKDYSELSLEELHAVYEAPHLYHARVRAAIESEVIARVQKGDMPTADLAKLSWVRDPRGACRAAINAAILRHAARPDITARELADLCLACLSHDGSTYAAVDEAIARRVQRPDITEEDLTTLWLVMPGGTPGRRALNTAYARLEDEQEKT